MPSPMDFPTNTGRWRKQGYRVNHNIRSTAERKNAELSKQLREMGNNNNDRTDDT